MNILFEPSVFASKQCVLPSQWHQISKVNNTDCITVIIICFNTESVERNRVQTIQTSQQTSDNLMKSMKKISLCCDYQVSFHKICTYVCVIKTGTYETSDMSTVYCLVLIKRSLSLLVYHCTLHSEQ